MMHDLDIQTDKKNTFVKCATFLFKSTVSKSAIDNKCHKKPQVTKWSLFTSSPLKQRPTWKSQGLVAHY